MGKQIQSALSRPVRDERWSMMMQSAVHAVIVWKTIMIVKQAECGVTALLKSKWIPLIQADLREFFPDSRRLAWISGQN